MVKVEPEVTHVCLSNLSMSSQGSAISGLATSRRTHHKLGKTHLGSLNLGTLKKSQLFLIYTFSSSLWLLISCRPLETEGDINRKF